MNHKLEWQYAMHILISGCYKLDSPHGSGNQGEASDLSREVTAKKKKEVVHLKTRVNTIACFIACVHCLFNTCCGHMDAS